MLQKAKIKFPSSEIITRLIKGKEEFKNESQKKELQESPEVLFK